MQSDFYGRPAMTCPAMDLSAVFHADRSPGFAVWRGTFAYARTAAEFCPGIVSEWRIESYTGFS